MEITALPQICTVVAHDAGGAELISSYVRRQGLSCLYVLEGPARKVFARKLGRIELLPLNDAIERADWLLCGTSWQSELEFNAIKLARARGKRTVAFLDHWVNYPERFIRSNVQHLPDEIWVADEDAERLARKHFQNTSIRLVPNPYFSDMQREIAELEVQQRTDDAGGKTVLFVSENISDHARMRYGNERYWGYTEFDAIKYLFENINALDDQIRSVVIRPHPSDPAGKYACIVNAYPGIARLSVGRSLVKEIVEADIVVGCQSIAMVVGLLATKKVVSCIPPNGDICCLPQKNILHLTELVIQLHHTKITENEMKKQIRNCSQILRSFLSGLRQYKRKMVHRVAMRQLYKRGREPNLNNAVTLFWVPGGLPLMLHVEGSIAAALRLRGSGVHAVICDGVFIACVKREIKDKQPISRWRETCATCKRDCAAVLHGMDIPYSYIGDYVSEQTITELRQVAKEKTWENLDELCYGEIDLGKSSRSAILRYLQGNSFPNDPLVVREYAFSALVCAAAAANAFNRMTPARIMMSHGTYVDWGPALHTALTKRIPVVAWMASYLPARFYFRHVEDGLHIDFHNMSPVAWGERSRLELTGDQSECLNTYLQTRYKEDISFDMKRFKKYTGRAGWVRDRYGLDAARPVWGIMTHINWDTVSDYAPMIYESFNAWVVDTIHEIKNITDIQWIIKVHPAEAWDNPDSGVECLIKQHFPVLPEHIRVLPAEEDISPLDFYQMIDGGITVYGTAGLESALQGKPVVLAGEAHYGRKGFTYDSDSQASYRELLNKASSLPALSEVQVELARRYAYCYFIQRQVPLSIVRDPQSKWWSFQFDKRELLLEGHDPVIDFVCHRILDGKDFIMDEYLLSLTDAVGA